MKKDFQPKQEWKSNVFAQNVLQCEVHVVLPCPSLVQQASIILPPSQLTVMTWQI